jgi:hypothetical protein
VELCPEALHHAGCGAAHRLLHLLFNIATRGLLALVIAVADCIVLVALAITIFVIWNLSAATTLSKHYIHILYHQENMLSITEHRLSTSFWFPIKMFSFHSKGVIEGKKSTMAHIYDLPTIFHIKAVDFI